MPTRTRIRSHIEQFAAHTHRLGLVILTISIIPAQAKTGLANLAYNLANCPGTTGEERPHDGQAAEKQGQ